MNVQLPNWYAWWISRKKVHIWTCFAAIYSKQKSKKVYTAASWLSFWRHWNWKSYSQSHAHLLSSRIFALIISQITTSLTPIIKITSLLTQFSLKNYSFLISNHFPKDIVSASSLPFTLFAYGATLCNTLLYITYSLC